MAREWARAFLLVAAALCPWKVIGKAVWLNMGHPGAIGQSIGMI